MLPWHPILLRVSVLYLPSLCTILADRGLDRVSRTGSSVEVTGQGRYRGSHQQRLALGPWIDFSDALGPHSNASVSLLERSPSSYTELASVLEVSTWTNFRRHLGDTWQILKALNGARVHDGNDCTCRWSPLMALDETPVGNKSFGPGECCKAREWWVYLILVLVVVLLPAMLCFMCCCQTTVADDPKVNLGGSLLGRDVTKNGGSFTSSQKHR
mmetsp:Transcript_105990/g.210681  ORF Transcript_105990/g.210681 Transcript_105990/m.210681 type:complete len:214 (+) Transcript_105990:72-713(+)